MTEKNITSTENLVQDISKELIFGRKHNGIECALCPSAKRACDRAWFTEMQIEKWSRMSTETLCGSLKRLEKVSRICSLKDSIECDIPTDDGDLQVAQLYNLNVLNQLAMVCIDNEKLNDISCKFSDILSEGGANGSYSIRKPASYMIEDKIERTKRWIEETEEWKEALYAVKTAYDETKVLLAREKAYYEMLSEVVDEFVRTSPLVNGKKVASDLGTDGAESKECEQARITARDWCFKHKLPIYAIEPKRTVSELLTDICGARPDREQWYRNSSGTLVFPKWACDILDKVYEDYDMFLSDYRTE